MALVDGGCSLLSEQLWYWLLRCHLFWTLFTWLCLNGLLLACSSSTCPVITGVPFLLVPSLAAFWIYISSFHMISSRSMFHLCTTGWYNQTYIFSPEFSPKLQTCSTEQLHVDVHKWSKINKSQIELLFTLNLFSFVVLKLVHGTLSS